MILMILNNGISYDGDNALTDILGYLLMKEQSLIFEKFDYGYLREMRMSGFMEQEILLGEE